MNVRQSDNQRKTRTIYYLIDTGKQMAGDKIGAMNSAMEEAITVDLPDIASSLGEDIKVAIIQFSDGASWITESGAVNIGDVLWNDLHASGANDFGCALRVLAEDLQKFDSNIHNEPIIIAFSNAPVTDSYMEPLEELERYECFQNSLRIGIAIGEDADKNALATFSGTPECVITINDRHSLKELIEKYIERQRGSDMIDLKSILKQHPNCLNSRASFKAVLMDKYPSERRMVNILTILFECGVANRIKAKKTIDANEMQGIIAQVENEYGISEQYSQDAILVWAAAFDVTASAIKIDNTAAAPQIAAKTVVYVQGDVDDYDIVQEEDGYYISHFNGFEEDEMTIPSMIDGNPIIGIGARAFKGLGIVKTIHVGEGIKVISQEAFSNCSSLINVTLPQTLERLGNYTFKDCYSLKEIDIPDRVKKIPVGCFRMCTRLKKVKLPACLETICIEAFAWGGNLKEIHIPVGTKTIEPDAFFSNRGLEAAYIPPSVTTIYDGNFINYEKYGNRPSVRMTIYCTAGSAAMEYARENNIKCAKAQF